jgi:3-oxoacyl-[acyl-carrier protein] reductase
MAGGLGGKTALVTGAGGGIGRACAAAFAREGALVVCADLDRELADYAAGAVGGRAVVGDVSDPGGARRVVEEAGAPDVVVTGHGIFQATAAPDIEADEWDRVQAVNLRGTFLVCQVALEQMVPRRSGSIVTIASLAGQVGGLQAGAGYAASKAGVAALTKSLARYAGPHGVRVNCVNPGFIDTSMTADWPAEAKESVVSRTPLGRIGTPEEVAEAVVWVASDRAAFVHGAHLDVNGGLHMD